MNHPPLDLRARLFFGTMPFDSMGLDPLRPNSIYHSLGIEGITIRFNAGTTLVTAEEPPRSPSARVTHDPRSSSTLCRKIDLHDLSTATFF